jgi:hypothetical protein
MQPSAPVPALRLLPVDPHRLYAYWTVAVAGQLRLATAEGDTLLEVTVGPEEKGAFFDLPEPVHAVVATLSVAGEATLHSAPLHLPADRPQRSMVVWGRADGSALPALPARTGGGLPYLPPRSNAGSHIHAASRSARTTASTTSPGNSWRRS